MLATVHPIHRNRSLRSRSDVTRAYRPASRPSLPRSQSTRVLNGETISDLEIRVAAFRPVLLPENSAAKAPQLSLVEPQAQAEPLPVVNPQSSFALHLLRENVRELSQMQSRLRFLCRELEELEKL